VCALPQALGVATCRTSSQETQPLLFPDILSSIAGTAVTLAGFAAVFRAFGNNHDPDGQSRVRLNSVIEGGLLIVVVSYIPVLVGGLGLGYGDDLPWVVGCAVIALWALPRICAPTYRILQKRDKWPEMFVPVVAAGVISLFVAALTVVGLWPFGSFSGYLWALVFLLSNVSLVFIAQFRVEQTDEHET
jgi:hypothetical protein